MAPPVGGLRSSLCTLELAVYYGSPPCPLCARWAGPEPGIPLVWSRGNLTAARRLLSDGCPVPAETVRAAGILLLLGIGSFVCYKLFRRLRLDLRKKCDCDSELFEAFGSSQWVSEELLSRDAPSDDECVEEKYFGPESFGDSDAQSRISDTSQSLDTDCNSGSWGDREFTSDSPQLSDSGEEIMGISASNHCIPVFFDKTNGVFFNYHPKPHQCDSSLKQNLASPLFDPCSSLETSFLPNKVQRSKPKCSPNRNIYLGNKNENVCRYKSKISQNGDSCNDGVLEENFQMVCNSDLETDTSMLSHWDQDQDILSTCDSFSFDESVKFQETSSLRANFSPTSLQERYLKAESYFLHEKALNNLKVGQLSIENNEKSGVLSDSHILHMKRDASSADSLSNISDQLFINNKQVKRLFHQDISVDSETSDFSLDIQPQTTELGYQTVGQLEQLQNQLCEVKKAVQELDKEFVELKIYEMPPKHSWELSAISPSDVDQSSGSENEKNSASDVTRQNFKEIVSKISNNSLLLEKTDKPIKNNKSFNLDLNSMPLEPDQCLKNVPVPSLHQPNIECHSSNQTNVICTSFDGTSTILESEVKSQTKNLDSGSDFGNSLDSELGETYEIRRSCSLEWDPMCLPEYASTLDYCQSFPSPTDTLASLSEFIHDQEIVSPLSESESKDIKVFQVDHNNSLKKCCRSHSIPSEMCTQEIQNLAFKKNLLKRSITLPYCKNIQTENDSFYQKQIAHSSIMSGDSLSLKFPCENSLYSSEESGFLDTQSIKKNETIVNETDVCSASSSVQSDIFKEKTKYLLEDDNGNTCFITENQSTSTVDPMNASINRDSAYCEESFVDNYLIKNIGHKQNLVEYSFLTWKGETLKNKQIRKGYEEIAEAFGFKYLRVVRKDDYCAIRAALFQVLSQGLPVLNHHNSAKLIYQKLQRWIDGTYPWLTEWNFGEKLSYTGSECMQGFYNCLHVLQSVEDELKRCAGREDRLTELLNRRPDVDAHLMQAVKILMTVSALKFRRAFLRRRTVPVFAALLLAPDDSPRPGEFLGRRLNRAGNGAGIDEAEMCLLGHSLSAVLRVIRPHRRGREDFVARYPEEEFSSGPEVTLIEENPRGYHVPVG
ncbi:uncharacterized protein [Centruroides vittatus]|uniref:uncharacterized protein isoform X1 n=2 Tax=Centruroides vittatus TaxID=120091 RepID=UPI003510153E